ncbi:hypothetical protein Asppvi_004421 [Aspergillus pseudoviridinutans]|uniref:Zn(II)2Cys6 transcription factor n=1 Tax=Aspergillus pseudoviridinutans TaxID=1517512 RepID=A0A9P3B6G4_9EURO|nr:uncharacterized protein Asppvi_004421 [Aspergillus pseudoviridinutans]GIJ85562.1 hypothetical protein Asppvi_004421 [Aspergillus pseudoviridinutans]
MALSEASITETSSFQRKNPWSINQTVKHTAGQFSFNTRPLAITEAAILTLLLLLKRLVSDISQTWGTRPNSDVGLLEILAQNAYKSDTISTAYWMFVRLELGIALANDMAMRISLPSLPSHPAHYLPLLACTEDVSERVSRFTHVALWLCAKALALCHQREMGHDRSSVEDWILIFRALSEWYELRPPDFQPMVEIGFEHPSDSNSEFPLLLFANGAGTFNNQLYHTALVLLLQCKPRTAKLQQYQSTLLSPLWHAKRICGIALNNDSRESWDPCLLASLLIASKHMTHESQQQAIIRGFQRITKITGWDIGQYLVDLRDYWSTLEDA